MSTTTPKGRFVSIPAGYRAQERVLVLGPFQPYAITHLTLVPTSR